MLFSLALKCDIEILFLAGRHRLGNNSELWQINFCERQTAVSEILGFSEILCCLFIPCLFLQKTVDLNRNLKVPIVQC